MAKAQVTELCCTILSNHRLGRHDLPSQMLHGGSKFMLTPKNPPRCPRITPLPYRTMARSLMADTGAATRWPSHPIPCRASHLHALRLSAGPGMVRKGTVGSREIRWKRHHSDFRNRFQYHGDMIRRLLSSLWRNGEPLNPKTFVARPALLSLLSTGSQIGLVKPAAERCTLDCSVTLMVLVV